MRSIRSSIIVSIVFLFGCGSDSEDHSAGINPKIIHGEEISSPESTGVVKIWSYTQDWFALCSGTVISNNTVLTAAHCLNNAVDAEVEIGADRIPVSGVHIHPEYSAEGEYSALFHDVAIVRTEKPLNALSRGLVVSKEMQAGDSISIVGFGVDENLVGRVLREGTMQISFTSEDHLFAGYLGRLSNVCYGDSGGPAFTSVGDTEDKQRGVVGITSTGTKQDCSAGAMSLFTNIQEPSNLEFILSVVPEVALY